MRRRLAAFAGLPQARYLCELSHTPQSFTALNYELGMLAYWGAGVRVSVLVFTAPRRCVGANSETHPHARARPALRTGKSGRASVRRGDCGRPRAPTPRHTRTRASRFEKTGRRYGNNQAVECAARRLRFERRERCGHPRRRVREPRWPRHPRPGACVEYGKACGDGGSSGRR